MTLKRGPGKDPAGGFLKSSYLLFNTCYTQKEPLAFALRSCRWEEEIKKVGTVGSKNYTKKEHY